MTIITMGLGNGIRIAHQEILHQAGDVTFQNVTPRVRITDHLIRESFKEKEKDIDFEEEKRKEVMKNE